MILVRAPIAFACALTVIGCRPSAPPVSRRPDAAPDVAAFEERLERLRTQLEVPGMSAAIGKNGRVAWSKSFGFADVGAERPPTDTTAYHLASLTKLFGAVVLLRLADSGLVSLDDSVSKFGITLPNDTGIRVRHLLSMTSGGPTPGERF